jgi:hypothetical protein
MWLNFLLMNWIENNEEYYQTNFSVYWTHFVTNSMCQKQSSDNISATFIQSMFSFNDSQGKVVGVVSSCELVGLEFKSQWWRDFLRLSRWLQIPSGRMYDGYQEWCSWGMASTTHPIWCQGWRKGRALPVSQPCAFVVCYRVNFTLAFTVVKMFWK